tara:strand:- start:3425 stop:4810 length:1386 start_codon:yes stop_codon:yes gene_type:complete
MSFYEPKFLLIFFPIFIIYLFIFRKKIFFKYGVIVFGLIFYSNGSIKLLEIIIFSCLMNYFLIKEIKFQKNFSKYYLLINLFFNISFLFFHKVNPYENSILPLAISFYTFQNIALAVDIYKNKNLEFKFSDYLNFILFFPQLISGPIARYSQLYNQTKLFKAPDSKTVALGLSIFIIGLFKKVYIVNFLFDINQLQLDILNNLEKIPLVDFYLFSSTYTFQIYYDFSAYSEMAVGLALICGITLPWNFYSPLKASNMIEFWRNWHITLSNFFKDYVYIPLGGSRNGGLRKLFNLLIVFSISGIWHGVGLNFLIWGFLNGFFVSINHLFMKFIDLKKIIGSRFLSIFFTFTIVSFIFNFFRFENLKDLQNIFMRITFRGFSNEIYYVTESFKNYYILIILFFVTFFFPNVKDLLINSRENIKFKKFITNYNLSTTIIFSIILYLFIIRISKVEMQQFLYYQF